MPEMSPEAAKFTNATFARIFNEIGAMMELKGESPFKVRAIRRIPYPSARIRKMPLTTFASSGSMTSVT